MQDGRVGPWQRKATPMYMITSNSSIKRNLQDNKHSFIYDLSKTS